jgi:hypothetical protein
MSNGKANEFDWSGLIRDAIKVVSTALAAAAVWFGIKKATETVDKVNKDRPDDQKITGAREACVYTQAANTSCQNFGKVMTGVTSIVEAINSIMNPNQFQNNMMGFGYNSYGYGNFGQFSGPVANPLGMMYNPQPFMNNNNGYNGPMGMVDLGNNTHMQFNPDGSHRIYAPGGSYAYCTGFPWGN